MLSDTITLQQIDAAELMLKDFYILLPQLYGESSCTHNAHLLIHLPKFVRLWGPLWTHSAFGFENKNGRLKHLFHGNSDVIHQITFNIDVCYTMQEFHQKMVVNESEETVNYINTTNHQSPRSNMLCIGNHIYIVGKHKVMTPNAEQSVALGGYVNKIEVFSRLLKDRILYYSTTYERSMQGKRDNTHCSFRDNARKTVSFGRIQSFTNNPGPYALVRKLKQLEPTLIKRAGLPCREQLNPYQQVDILDNYITPVELDPDSQLQAVPIDHIISPSIIVSVKGVHYCIMQTNIVEHY